MPFKCVPSNEYFLLKIIFIFKGLDDKMTKFAGCRPVITNGCSNNGLSAYNTWKEKISTRSSKRKNLFAWLSLFYSYIMIRLYIMMYHYTALLNAVERSVHLHGPSPLTVAMHITTAVKESPVFQPLCNLSTPAYVSDVNVFGGLFLC